MDYIYVYNEKNEEEKMEVVLIYEIPNNKYHYIIYRTMDGKNYYTGKYEGEEIVDLNTDLDSNEMEFANKVLKGVLE